VVRGGQARPPVCLPRRLDGIRSLVGKNDWPRFVEDEPEIYEREEVAKFFAACSGEEKLWYEFFLMTGLREQEVMYCTRSEVNLLRGVVTVRYKPEFGFSPKAYKGREVPIPDRLVKALKKLKPQVDTLIRPIGGRDVCAPSIAEKASPVRRGEAAHPPGCFGCFRFYFPT
jgi:integrase